MHGDLAGAVGACKKYSSMKVSWECIKAEDFVLRWLGCAQGQASWLTTSHAGVETCFKQVGNSLGYQCALGLCYLERRVSVALARATALGW